jgi:hypothetical protein
MPQPLVLFSHYPPTSGFWPNYISAWCVLDERLDWDICPFGYMHLHCCLHDYLLLSLFYAGNTRVDELLECYSRWTDPCDYRLVVLEKIVRLYWACFWALEWHRP